MSTAEGAGQREEGEYGRAAKRLKTEETEADEREEGEEELEEGEDSDSGSLPGNGQSATDNRARWSASQFGAAGRGLYGEPEGESASGEAGRGVARVEGVTPAAC